MRDLTVMITGCSKHSKEIVDCLKQNEDGRQVKVVAVNMDVNKLLQHGTDYQEVVPPITDPEYIPRLKEICKELKVDVIIPYITAELGLLAHHKKEFEEIGVKVSVEAETVIAVLNDKENFYKRFNQYMPEEYSVVIPEDALFFYETFRKRGKKVCCKISGRCGGTGFCVIDNEKVHDITLFNRCGVNRYITITDLVNIVGSGHKVIMQEYIEGVDYSVCVLANHGKIIAMKGYAGYDMEFGAVVNGEIIDNEKAFEITEKLVASSALDGNLCFDFILPGITADSDYLEKKRTDAKLLECNPRINASIGFCWHAGANLVYLRCKQLIGELTALDIANANSGHKEGLRMQKYYESEYYL